MRLIDADALKKAIIELNLDNSSHWSVIYKIDNAPTIDTYTEDDVQYAIEEGHQVGYEMAKAKFERPQGEWEFFSVGNNQYSRCSICKDEHTSEYTDLDWWYDNFKYCPNCGAKMTKEAESD